MLEKVISGGQTGADQAGWRAAKALGIPTGGWMPKRFRTETPDGLGWGEAHPEFAELYGAREHPLADYPPRTDANARDSDLTIWLDGGPHCIGGGDRRGFYRTRKSVVEWGKEYVITGWSEIDPTPEELVGQIRKYSPKVINIAGNRESKAPGIGEWAEAYLIEVFRLLLEAQ